MIEAIGSGITSMIGWLGDVVEAVVTTEGALSALLPVFALGVAVTVIGVAIGYIRSFTFGA